MNNEHHSISIQFARTILEVAVKQGLDEKQLLSEAGLSKALIANKSVRITPQQMSWLVQSIWTHSDDEYLCMTRQPARHGLFSLMAKQVLPSGNLRQVYRRGARFYNIVNDTVQYRIEESKARARFYITLLEPERDPDNALIDFLLLVWHRFPSWLIGQKIPLKEMNLSYSKPEHHEEHRHMYPCKTIYDQSENCFEFDRDILNARLVQTQQSLSAYLRRCPLDWFQRQSYYPVYTRKVMNYLEQEEQMINLNMENCAKQMHTTIRTLRRKLLDEGTSFQELKDKVRRDQAIHFLSQPDIPISQISRSLGYTEPATFTRAFKHWTGISPSMYRKSKD